MGLRILIKIAKPIVERFHTVAMLYRNIRDKNQIAQEPKETPMGFKFIGNLEMEQGIFEPEETNIVKRFLCQADVFINVGANIGYYCCYALKYCQYTVAFEPIELNLRYLYKNIQANQFTNTIEVFPIALSNNTGITEFYGFGTGASLIKGWAGAPEKYVTTVPVSTLDNVLGHRFTNKKMFILVDIEGAEKHMLEGACIMLDRDPKPIWMVEICFSEHQPKGVKFNPNFYSIFTIFWDKGYEAWTADKHPRFVSPHEVETMVRSGTDTLLTHNFLFIESGKKDEILDA
jgi:FkbM family methyltransferase